MGKRMLQREDRKTVNRLFIWIECLSAVMVFIMLGLAFFA